MQTLIHTPTNDLQQSLDFYTRLKFKILSQADPVLVTDGKVVIEINPDRYARAGVKLYKLLWEKAVGDLAAYAHVIKTGFGYLLSDPSGVWVYLVEGGSGLHFERAGASYSVLGNFAGISLETTDMGKSAAVWETIGFSERRGSAEAGWISLENADKMTVSLMKPFSCPHLFFNPSLTYFNGKANNPKVIQQIRDLDIPIAEEITYFNKEGIVDNIIIRDPGGYGFFIFND